MMCNISYKDAARTYKLPLVVILRVVAIQLTAKPRMGELGQLRAL